MSETLFEKLQRIEEKRLYFIRQKLFGLFIILIGIGMCWLASEMSDVFKELRLIAIVMFGLGGLLLITKHKALG